MIGTMCRPMSALRNSVLRINTNAFVVEASPFLSPFKNCPKSASVGTFNGGAFTVRFGRKPPSALRRSIKYVCSGLPSSGR